MFDKNLILSKLNAGELYNNFLWLEKKQQYLVIAGVVLVLLLILFLPISCVSSRLNAREAEYLKQSAMAGELFAKLEKYKKLQGAFGDRGMKGLGRDPLQRIMYQVASDVGIEINELKTLSDTEKGPLIEKSKEVNLRRVDLEKLLDFIDRLTTGQKAAIQIKQATLKPHKVDKQKVEEVKMLVSILVEKEKAPGTESVAEPEPPPSSKPKAEPVKETKTATEVVSDQEAKPEAEAKPDTATEVKTPKTLGTKPKTRGKRGK